MRANAHKRQRGPSPANSTTEETHQESIAFEAEQADLRKTRAEKVEDLRAKIAEVENLEMKAGAKSMPCIDIYP